MTDPSDPRHRRDRRLRLQDEVLSVIEELTDEVIEMRERLRRGEAPGKPDTTRRLAELRQWLKLSVDMENTVVQVLSDAEGRGTAAETDLETLRSEIGCRLNRLRECCASETVPD